MVKKASIKKPKVDIKKPGSRGVIANPEQHISKVEDLNPPYMVKAQTLKGRKLKKPLSQDLGQMIILTGIATKPERMMTSIEKMNLTRKGISKKSLEILKSKTKLDYNNLSKILSTNMAELINIKGAQKFDQALSERILGIADIYSYGYAVFEDEEKFKHWMFSPNRAMGGSQPFDLLDSQFGREEVRNIISRIEFGVYS